MRILPQNLPYPLCSRYSRYFTFQNQALTVVQTFPIISRKTEGPTSSQRPESTSLSHFALSIASSLSLIPTMPVMTDQTILVYTHLEMLSHYDHVPMGYMNRTNWIPQAEPLIDIPRSRWDEHQFVPEIDGNASWVDIVVNNLDDKGHPFHLVSLYPFPTL